MLTLRSMELCQRFDYILDALVLCGLQWVNDRRHLIRDKSQKLIYKVGGVGRMGKREQSICND